MRYHLKCCASVVVTEIETNKVYDMYLIDICYAGRKQKKTKQVAKSGILEKLFPYYEFCMNMIFGKLIVCMILFPCFIHICLLWCLVCKHGSISDIMF